MPTAFGSSADFSGFADQPLLISSVEHSAFVNVDEQGTTAAAATGVSASYGSALPSVVADHPFLFLIRDRLTGALLLFGRIVDPSPDQCGGRPCTPGDQPERCRRGAEMGPWTIYDFGSP
jgi:serine protease inhibitor